MMDGEEKAHAEGEPAASLIESWACCFVRLVLVDRRIIR